MSERWDHIVCPAAPHSNSQNIGCNSTTPILRPLNNFFSLAGHMTHGKLDTLSASSGSPSASQLLSRTHHCSSPSYNDHVPSASLVQANAALAPQLLSRTHHCSSPSYNDHVPSASLVQANAALAPQLLSRTHHCSLPSYNDHVPSASLVQANAALAPQLLSRTHHCSLPSYNDHVPSASLVQANAALTRSSGGSAPQLLSRTHDCSLPALYNAPSAQPNVAFARSSAGSELGAFFLM